MRIIMRNIIILLGILLIIEGLVYVCRLFKKYIEFRILRLNEKYEVKNLNKYLLVEGQNKIMAGVFLIGYVLGQWYFSNSARVNVIFDIIGFILILITHKRRNKLISIKKE